MKKGQISSIDALIAILIFVLVISAIRTIWLDNVNTTYKNANYTEMSLSSQQAFDILTKTRGWPENWEANTVFIIGLADKPNVLSETKINIFESIPYADAKEMLSLQKYDFSFDINSINPSYNKHIGSSLDGNIIVSLNKRVIYKGGEAIVTFKVFTS